MAFAGRLDGQAVVLHVEPDRLRITGGPETIELAWVELDRFIVDGHACQLESVDGRRCTVTHLAATRDRFLAEALEARRRARRAALLQWTGDAPLASFDGRRGDEPVVVSLFPDGVVAEPVNGVPGMLPLSCLVEVRRAGYEIELIAAGLDDLTIRHLGQRTDEFLQRLDRARLDLADRTAASLTALDARLAGVAMRDGWAVEHSAVPAHWAALREVVAGQRRAAEVGVLAELAGDRLRLGVKSGAGGASMPFALAPVAGKVAVEATDVDDRATFVFATDDVDRLNAVLLATSFRREAIAAPDDALGRWALAVRTLDVVRWARARLVARIVHDAGWEAKVRSALA